MPDQEVNITRKHLAEKYPFYNFDTCVERFPRFIFDNAKNFYAIYQEDSLIVLEHVLSPQIAQIHTHFNFPDRRIKRQIRTHYI